VLLLSRDWWQKHAMPSQRAHQVYSPNSLANAVVEADHDTLRHPRVGNIFSLGDVCAHQLMPKRLQPCASKPVIASLCIIVLS
jgi:sulfide:quinone oxidoreductase